MKNETIEEFLARGGKVSKSDKSDASLDELLKEEGLIDDKGAKAIASLISTTISESIKKETENDKE